MVNRLSDLASFLEDQSIPAWVKKELDAHREEIERAFANGLPFTLVGPDGTSIELTPEKEEDAA